MLNKIRNSYLKAPYFEPYFSELSDLLLEPAASISDLNLRLIKWVCSHLKHEQLNHPLNQQSASLICSLWWGKIKKLISKLRTELTKYSDADRMTECPDLFYGDPLLFFDFCKRNFSRNVALLHDYGLYDFTILVRKDR